MHRARPSLLAALALVALLAPAPRARAADPRTVGISLASIARGLNRPIAIVSARDGSGRLFIVEQIGRIRIYKSGSLLSTPYLDIRSRVSCCGERGLLGLAFHPKFATNGTFFVSYTAAETGAVRLSRFRASPSGNRASASTEAVFLSIAHGKYPNHNGGQVAFGPDGYLYLGVGDGGGSGDPDGNAQDTGTLLGKIVRIDVNRACGTRRYCSPSTNPFVGRSGADEIWHYGLRNPWRFSFDRSTGVQWIGDVGQAQREEIDRIPKGVGGKNLGWDCREGTLTTTYGGDYCAGKTFTPPRYQYAHSSGRCAVIGGYVYRGSRYSSLLGGIYVYGDYCTGEIWGLGRRADGTWVNARMRDHGSTITSFGEGATNELYLADGNGVIWRLKAYRR